MLEIHGNPSRYEPNCWFVETCWIIEPLFETKGVVVLSQCFCYVFWCWFQSKMLFDAMSTLFVSWFPSKNPKKMRTTSTPTSFGRVLPPPRSILQGLWYKGRILPVKGRKNPYKNTYFFRTRENTPKVQFWMILGLFWWILMILGWILYVDMFFTWMYQNHKA